MDIFEGDKRAQGATEYLLMLAAVLVVVAVAVSMLMGMGPNLEASGTVSVTENDSTLYVNVTEVNIAPNDAEIENVSVLNEAGETASTSVSDFDSKNIIEIDATDGPSADSVSSVVFKDSEGNTTSLTPI